MFMVSLWQSLQNKISQHVTLCWGSFFWIFFEPYLSYVPQFYGNCGNIFSWTFVYMFLVLLWLSLNWNIFFTAFTLFFLFVVILGVFGRFWGVSLFSWKNRWGFSRNILRKCSWYYSDRYYTRIKFLRRVPLSWSWFFGLLVPLRFVQYFLMKYSLCLWHFGVVFGPFWSMFFK